MSPLAELEPILVKPLRRESTIPPAPASARVSVPLREAPIREIPVRETPELDPVFVPSLRLPEQRRSARRSRQPKARPAVIKTAVTIVAAAAAFALVGRVAAFAVQPVVMTQQMGGEVQQLQRQLAVENQANARLMQDIAYLKTPAGTEQEARRRGLVRMGEVPMSFVMPEGAPAPAAAPAPRPRSVAERIRAAVDTSLAVFGGAR